jgi:hypothetical protein
LTEIFIEKKIMHSTIRRMKKRAILLLTILSGLTAFHSAVAKTVTAVSPSQSDVAAAIAAASNGDTILIPAGTATWNSTLTVSKWLSFVGAGIDKTTIIVNVPNPGGDPTNAGLVLQGNGYNQVSGITFDGNNLTARPALTVWAGKVRITNCRFVNCVCGPYIVGPFGVLDHNQFVNCHLSVRVYGIGNGGQNWVSYYPIPFDSMNYLFIEDNTFTMNNSMLQNFGDGHAWVSAGQGSSYVARYNTFNQSRDGMTPCFDWHGDSNDGTRGATSTQIYGNTLNLSGSAYIDKFVDARGGQGLVYSNAIKAPSTSQGGRGVIVREEWPAGTIVSGVRVYDSVNNQWQWGNTINGAGFPSTSCETGCSGLDYHNGQYSGSYAQVYPHPLVSDGGSSNGGGTITGGGGANGSLRIVFSSMSVSEASGSAQVTVVRESGASGAVAVSYATTDSAGLAGTYYTPSSGTLSWADGDSASRTVQIPIAKVGFSGTKTLALGISNPTGGATLGTPASTSISIVGAGTSAGTPPTPPTNLRLVRTY